MTGPVLPRGVRLEHPDGSTTPCELAYRGLDDEGMHIWEAITPVQHGDRLKVAMLPARTGISFPAGGAA